MTRVEIKEQCRRAFGGWRKSFIQYRAVPLAAFGIIRDKGGDRLMCLWVEVLSRETLIRLAQILIADLEGKDPGFPTIDL